MVNAIMRNIFIILFLSGIFYLPLSTLAAGAVGDCPGGAIGLGDIDFKVQENGIVQSVAVSDDSSNPSASKLKIFKGSKTYSVLLVDPIIDPCALKTLIQTSAGPKALKRYCLGVGCVLGGGCPPTTVNVTCVGPVNIPARNEGNGFGVNCPVACGGGNGVTATYQCIGGSWTQVTDCVPVPNCGNGVIDAGELCDGANLNGATCSSQGVSNSGTLGCSSTCDNYDYSGCFSTSCAPGTCCMVWNPSPQPTPASSYPSCQSGSTSNGLGGPVCEKKFQTDCKNDQVSGQWCYIASKNGTCSEGPTWFRYYWSQCQCNL
ncbi:MAG: hypothetical protein HY209_04810 [Candidatus Omnitrophica bacterium]|nr:hypothetical protein [Candidatus Omnitrophota bacterium]